MSETDENSQVTEGKDYTAQIKSQQEEWDALGGRRTGETHGAEGKP